MINGYHEFNKSLADSHAASTLPFWEELYRKAFPTMIEMIYHPHDGYQDERRLKPEPMQVDEKLYQTESLKGHEANIGHHKPKK